MEMRYEHGYLYIDRTGEIATELSSKILGAQMREANVERTVLTHLDTGVELTYGTKLASIISDMELCSLTKLYDSMESFFEIVIRKVNVKKLTRTGNRLTYHKSFGDEEASLNYIEKLHSSVHGKGSGLISDDVDFFKNTKTVQFSTRLESAKLGGTITIKAAKTGVELNGPVRLQKLVNVPNRSSVVVVDIDLYTLLPMYSSEFHPNQFMKSNVRMIADKIFTKFPS